MTLTKVITFSDIQTSDLNYFEPNQVGDCYKFCEDRDIDYLPVLDDQDSIYFRDISSKTFQRQIITEDRKVNGSINIFENQMLQRFTDNYLLLVYSGATLTGVVHYSDYNKPVVSIYLFELFLAYERSLRTLLVIKGLENSDMVAYFETKKHIQHYEDRIQEYYKNKIKHEKLQPFECFYLKELIALINHNKYIALKGDVSNLRNKVAHAREFVNMKDSRTDDLIYDLNTFKDFFTGVDILHKQYAQVSDYLASNHFKIQSPRTRGAS